MASSTPSAPPVSSTLGFRSIICGIDGSPSDAVVVDQASVLAGVDTALELVSVVERAVRTNAQFLFTPERAKRALRKALELARDAGASASEQLIEAGWGETAALLEHCDPDDLLVVGSHGVSRAEGILAGRTSTAAVHRAQCPVLVARPVSEFPGTVLLADDGGVPSDAAAELTFRLAARFGCEVLIAAPSQLDATERRRLAGHAATLRETTGREPVVVDVDGEAAYALARIAERHDVSLLVLGSRHLHGVRALSSVSERVAHRAHCSVLIVRR